MAGFVGVFIDIFMDLLADRAMFCRSQTIRLVTSSHEKVSAPVR